MVKALLEICIYPMHTRQRDKGETLCFHKYLYASSMPLRSLAGAAVPVLPVQSFLCCLHFHSISRHRLSLQSWKCVAHP